MDEIERARELFRNLEARDDDSTKIAKRAFLIQENLNTVKN